MKIFIVLALCLSSVLAEELHDRGVDFHTLHYSQHHQTVQEAKKKIDDVYDGQQAEFEEVGSYGGLGGVGLGVGTVGLSSTGLSGAGCDSQCIGSNAEFSSSGSSNFGASHSASSSFGSNSNFASGGYGSASHHSGAVGGSSLVIPVGGGSENYYHQEGRRVKSQTSTPIVQFAPSSGNSATYIRQEERHTQNQAVPLVQYTAPSGGYQKYDHYKEERVQQAPVQLVLSSPAGGQESYTKYHRISSTASQPNVVVHTAPSTRTAFDFHSTAGSTSGSQFGQSLTSGVSNDHVSNSNFHTVPSTAFGSSSGSLLNSVNSNSLLKTGFGSSHQAASNFDASSAYGAGHQAGFGANSPFTDISSFGSKLGGQSQFGSSFGTESKYNNHFGADSAFGAGSGFGGSSSSSGLANYIIESERLAKQQAQGMSLGGTRTGGSQFNSNMESGSASGYGGLGGVSGFGAGLGTGTGTGVGVGAGAGVGNSGYKTKSWETASKWSSQSEFGPDGQVNNYKELSTGESENYDINGRRSGYKAATTTLDDNGKVSSYSLHT